MDAQFIAFMCVRNWQPGSGSSLQDFFLEAVAEFDLTVEPGEVQAMLDKAFTDNARSIGQHVD